MCKKKSVAVIILNLTTLGGLIPLLTTLIISNPSMTNPAAALGCEFKNGGCTSGEDRGSGRSGLFGGGSIAPEGPGKPNKRENNSKPYVSPSSPSNPSNPSTEPDGKYPPVCRQKPSLPQCQ
jgi:hypothetical protein